MIMQSFTNSRPQLIRRYVGLLCLLFALLQFSFQLHPLEHLTETHHAECDTCQLQSSSHFAVPTAPAANAAFPSHSAERRLLQQDHPLLPFQAYCVRGPPTSDL